MLDLKFINGWHLLPEKIVPRVGVSFYFKPKNLACAENQVLAAIKLANCKQKRLFLLK